ncbi:hypothetical protein ACQR1W_31550 [Bradyrhizobium sp. HKCCYLS1011]|uniref:hypothetical protein n=1 Tax=Bradyrhizobium sp. HKCCYLS1011 TaxID=3420733 RepID=UPI003EB83D3A
MFVFVTGPEYHLPFQTFVVCRFQRNHMHWDVSGCARTEPMQLSVRVPALRLPAIQPPNNDNERPSDAL